MLCENFCNFRCASWLACCGVVLTPLSSQLTVNVVALLTAFVSSIYLGFSALTAVQLLWINLVMDTLGALALATDPPRSAELLARQPGRRCVSGVVR